MRQDSIIWPTASFGKCHCEQQVFGGHRRNKKHYLLSINYQVYRERVAKSRVCMEEAALFELRVSVTDDCSGDLGQRAVACRMGDTLTTWWATKRTKSTRSLRFCEAQQLALRGAWSEWHACLSPVIRLAAALGPFNRGLCSPLLHTLTNQFGNSLRREYIACR